MQANSTRMVPDDVYRYALMCQRDMRREARKRRMAPPTDEQIAAALARATGLDLSTITAELAARRR